MRNKNIVTILRNKFRVQKKYLKDIMEYNSMSNDIDLTAALNETIYADCVYDEDVMVISFCGVQKHQHRWYFV